jgi:SAM-dependent methyltransferase
MDRARSFDRWANEYDRYRPGYPDALFGEIAARLRLPDRPHVADLGAGTGRATFAMARRGWHVTAVEPGRPMLDVLYARAADEGIMVSVVCASAEDTGLDPATVDLVTAAQAFHWFDATKALREMGRIVRRGGGIALFWNVRDAERSAMLTDYDALLARNGVEVDRQRAGPDPRTSAAIESDPAFRGAEFFQVRHVERLAPSAFIGLVFTSSYVQALETVARERFATELEAIVDRHASEQHLEVPYVVDCWIARRVDR